MFCKLRLVMIKGRLEAHELWGTTSFRASFRGKSDPDDFGYLFGFNSVKTQLHRDNWRIA